MCTRFRDGDTTHLRIFGLRPRQFGFLWPRMSADKLSAEDRGALAAHAPRRATRMGAAIRHALQLARETAGIKVLEHCFDATRRTTTRAPIGPTANTHPDTRAQHCEVGAGARHGFCVTIDPAGHDYLRRMCKETRYLVIDDVISLPHE